jgi:penicillin-binding protein 2
MLQLAQALATVVNDGVKHPPRLVIATEDSTTKQRTPVPKPEPVNLGFKPQNLEVIRKAMVAVTQQGTSTRVFQGAGYLSGGKTGTAQAVGVAQGARYNAAKLEEHQRDHSLYIAFAPAEDPKIAVAMIVENAGFGAAAAAPIARRVFDYYLLNQYPSEEDMALVREGKAGPPVGTPRLASEVAWPPPSPAAAAAAAASAPLPAASAPEAAALAAASTAPTASTAPAAPLIHAAFAPPPAAPAPQAAASAPQPAASAAMVPAPRTPPRAPARPQAAAGRAAAAPAPAAAAAAAAAVRVSPAPSSGPQATAPARAE